MEASTSFPLPRHITLRDGRVCLVRETTEDDAADLIEFVPKTHVESDFLAYLPGEFDLNLEQEKEYIRSQQSIPNSLLLMARDSQGEIAGLCGTRGTKFRRSAHQTEFGITVAKAYWGLGLGRALTQLVIDWVKFRGLTKLTLRVYEDNDRGIALYRSLGFVEEGRLKRDVLRADGRYSDTIVMAKFT